MALLILPKKVDSNEIQILALDTEGSNNKYLQLQWFPICSTVDNSRRKSVFLFIYLLYLQGQGHYIGEA